MCRCLLITVLFATACASPTLQDEAAQGTPTRPASAAAPAVTAAPAAEFERRYARLPADAARVLARLDACRYFPGEFNGDGSARDREVNARMDALGCAGVETEIPP